MARRLIAGLLAAMAVLAGCGTPRAPVTPGVVKVVAGENFWGNIAAAAQRLSASPLVVAALSVVFAVAAADGGLLASFGASNIKASVFITSISFAIYLAARVTGPMLRDHRRGFRGNRGTQSQDRVYARQVPEPAGTGMSRSDEPAGQLNRHVPSGLGWPDGLAGRSGNSRLPARNARTSRNDETPS